MHESKRIVPRKGAGRVPAELLPNDVIEENPMNAATQPIEIALDETGLPEGQILADSVRQWRADCQAGTFKIGAATMRGPKLDMEVIGAQISSGEFYGYPLQTWLAVLFVDPDGVLSSVLFKTESLDNFEETRRQYRLKGETLLGKTIRASMSKRVSRANGESYYAVEFEVVSEGRYARQIAEFRQLRYHPGLFRLLSGPAENDEGDKADGKAEPARKGKGK